MPTKFPEAAAWARRYRDLGYNPLPSCETKKMPAIQGGYRSYRDSECIPDAWLDSWWTPNIQIPTGCAWRLAVVDLDGLDAYVTWKHWCAQYGLSKPTWIARTGGGGYHVWYTLPDWLTCCPTRKVWGKWDPREKCWQKHTFIELIADQGLVVAPPSKHVRHGRPYEWLVSPDDFPRPAPIPDWVLWLPRITEPDATPYTPPRPPRPRQPLARGQYTSYDVLAVLSPDERLGLAKDWGLRVAAGARPRHNGWISCKAIDREDAHPSAGFNVLTGVYGEPFGRTLSLFDLAVALGQYRTWQDACNDLGARYGAPTRSEP
jgi:hypothetical protein